jgi:hypothetical protein
VTGSPARACWAAAEPFTIAALFSAEARAAVRDVGLPSISSYVVMRAAPLGAAHPAVVTAAFRWFPRSTFDILPVAWARLSPEDAVRRTHDVVTSWCAAVLDGQPPPAALAAELAGLVSTLDTGGRPLAAANQAVEPPDEPWARLWRALTTLREYRGDAHVAALVAAGLGLVESEVLTAAWAGDRVDLAMLRRTRRIDDAAWASARTGLASRGLLTDAGGLTAAGSALRSDVEDATDRASAPPYRELGPDGTRRLWQLATELSQSLIEAGHIPAVTPVGAPWPPPTLRRSGGG